MRLSELLGLPAVDAGGHDIGRVADLRLVRDDAAGAPVRIDGLILVTGSTTELLGYERHVGPALLRWLLHRRLGAVRYLPWRDVAGIDDGLVRSRTMVDELKPLDEMPRHEAG